MKKNNTKLKLKLKLKNKKNKNNTTNTTKNEATIKGKQMEICNVIYL
jgi:hypothetical protein